MGNKLLRFYLKFRDPKIFLIVLSAYIFLCLALHNVLAYDPDWGMTNLTLSIEATIAGAVLMMVAERSAGVQDTMAKLQREQLSALIAMAESDRKLSADTVEMLKQLIENDKQFLDLLERKWNPTNPPSQITTQS